MKQTVTGDMFVQAFQQIRPNNFSLEGLHLLYTGLESLESDLGNDIELDVIAICCDYTCLLYTSPSPRDGLLSRMPSSA